MSELEERHGPRAGDVIDDKYVIGEELGSGAMGVVLAARHRLLGHPVAIKFIAPAHTREQASLKRFEREARAVATLESEHIVRVLDFGVLGDGSPYMVMQRLVGSDLGEIARARGGKLSVSDAVDYVIQACAGLAEAHARGIVHRDIKPRNLFLTQRSNGEPLLKVLDFGISKARGELVEDLALTDTRTVLGSPLYVSPEQLRHSRSVDQRTDIWSLGIVLHQLCSGTHPFAGENVTALLSSIAADEPTPLRAVLPSAAPALEAIVLRCLEKSPAFRYRNAAALASALTPFASKSGALIAARLALHAAGTAHAEPEPASRRAGEPSLTATRTHVDTLSPQNFARSFERKRRTRSVGLALLGVTSMFAALGAALLYANARATGPSGAAAPRASADASAKVPVAPVSAEASRRPPAEVASFQKGLADPAFVASTGLPEVRARRPPLRAAAKARATARAKPAMDAREPPPVRLEPSNAPRDPLDGHT